MPSVDLSRFESKNLYDVYRVSIKPVDRLCGGVPKNPELLRGWLAAKTGHDDETTDAQEKETRDALLEPTEEKSWNGFLADPVGGLFIRSQQVKALFKECASMLRLTTAKIGSKQIFQHGFEIKGLQHDNPARVYLGRMKPDGYDEGPIHVQTPQGPRTAIKRVDYVEGIELTFEIWVLTTGGAEKRHVGEEDLIQLLTFGQENGLGADRSQGAGKFKVTYFERVASGKICTWTKEAAAAGEEADSKGKKKGKAAKGVNGTMEAVTAAPVE